MPLTPNYSPHGEQFADTYKSQIFTLWYTNGKPRASKLFPMIEDLDPIHHKRPTAVVLARWIREDFKELAKDLDEEVAEQLENTLVAEKIAMLERHAILSREMQEMGVKYLRENGVGGARNAIQLVIEGLRIEKESVGAPRISQKLLDMSDEQLLGELEKYVTSSKIIDIQPIEVGNSE